MQQAFAGIDLSPVIPPWLLAGLGACGAACFAMAAAQRSR